MNRGGWHLFKGGKLSRVYDICKATLCKPHLHCGLVSTCVVAAHCSIFPFVPPRAAHILRGTGTVVNLVVAKQAAAHYGLTHLIHQPSPRYSRKHDPHR